MENPTTMPTPPSSTAPNSTYSNPLPQPRHRPLTRGSPKETQLISYLDTTINAGIRKKVENRIVKRGRTSPPEPGTNRAPGTPEGYKSFTQVAKDVDGIVDVVWVSGSPTLQKPYLLTITNLLIDALPLFPPAPTPTFALLDKLDAAFASLLAGHDIESGAALPGFDGGNRVVSTTDKVRIKGVVERVRGVVARCVVSAEEEEEEENGEGEGEGQGGEGGGDDGLVRFEGFENDEGEEMGVGMDEEEEDVERMAGRVFEKTLAELGDVLGGEPIGIITEE